MPHFAGFGRPERIAQRQSDFVFSRSDMKRKTQGLQ
jgi:hypothetical protein